MTISAVNLFLSICNASLEKQAHPIKNELVPPMTKAAADRSMLSTGLHGLGRLSRPRACVSFGSHLGCESRSPGKKKKVGVQKLCYLCEPWQMRKSAPQGNVTIHFCRSGYSYKYPWSSPGGLLTHGELLVPFFSSTSIFHTAIFVARFSFHLDSFESAHVDESATL